MPAIPDGALDSVIVLVAVVSMTPFLRMATSNAKSWLTVAMVGGRSKVSVPCVTHAPADSTVPARHVTDSWLVARVIPSLLASSV